MVRQKPKCVVYSFNFSFTYNSITETLVFTFKKVYNENISNEHSGNHLKCLGQKYIISNNLKKIVYDILICIIIQEKFSINSY